MRWLLLPAVILGLSNTDVASFAEGPPGGRGLRSARCPSDDAGFFASAGVVRFQLIQGRLLLDPPRHRKGSQSRDENGIYESVTVTAQRGIPSLHYVLQTPDQHLTLNVQRATSVRIESWLPKTSERSVLEQPEMGPITWTQTRGELAEEHQGATLIHLRHADPVSFELHYELLIEMLLRGQSLARLSDATNDLLLERITTTSTPDVQSVRECVDQLRATRRASRVAAQRQLLAWGSTILPTIHTMRLDELEPEQSNRLRLIMKRLRPKVDDTPASLAMLLMNDREYWSRLSTRLSSDQLAIANQHLSRIGAKMIELASDPAERIASATE